MAGYQSEEQVGSWTYASSVRTIWVREGVGNGGHRTQMAGGIDTIWT